MEEAAEKQGKGACHGILSYHIRKNIRQSKRKTPEKSRVFVMEHMGFEPTASTMRMWRAPNCANAPDMEARRLELLTSRV